MYTCYQLLNIRAECRLPATPLNFLAAWQIIFAFCQAAKNRFEILGAELTVNLANWYNVLRALFSVQAFVDKLANVTRPVYCAVSSGTSKNPV